MIFFFLNHDGTLLYLLPHVQAMSMINSEESADDAFQLSSALTQALMDYRMKALGTVSLDVYL